MAGPEGEEAVSPPRTEVYVGITNDGDAVTPVVRSATATFYSSAHSARKNGYLAGWDGDQKRWVPRPFKILRGTITWEEVDE